MAGYCIYEPFAVVLPSHQIRARRAPREIGKSVCIWCSRGMWHAVSSTWWRSPCATDFTEGRNDTAIKSCGTLTASAQPKDEVLGGTKKRQGWVMWHFQIMGKYPT